AQVAATAAQQASLTARIAAELARHNPARSPDAARQLALAAARQEREAHRLQADAQLLDRQRLLAEAEQLPESDAGRAKRVEEAGQQLAAARSAVEKARQTIAQAADSSDFTPLGPSYPPTSTGRRRALARWMTSRDNPLTARVAVNHIWMRHFHTPLVGTVFDFGRNGQRPTHPELLDWLAVELMDSGWSMKHLHRLMVTSQAYRMRSGGPPDEASRLDPENRLLWRMNVGRMEAELVRDSLLHVAGRLDLRSGGQELENSEAASGQRRSLYYSCHPELDGKSQLGALFDAAEATECYRRTRSVVPQQALALTNSQLVHDVSRDVAADLWQAVMESAGDEQAFVVAAFEHLLSRQPSDSELAACLEYLAAGTDAATGPAAASGRESLVRVLLNHNDFLAIR
ncbi:MAG: DUF1553 domain-containing protein, partial [Pirellulaceae bacterium]|nr:DUF1553 domain-containing protein [Pirellulaceae bacterium]